MRGRCAGGALRLAGRLAALTAQRRILLLRIRVLFGDRLFKRFQATAAAPPEDALIADDCQLPITDATISRADVNRRTIGPPCRRRRSLRIPAECR
jgi:hypothetical protein